jgi:hypothetical protein
MKVGPSSKNTLQTPLCFERGWRHFVVGTAASLCVATVMAQAPITPTDSEPLTREQILALFEKEASAAYKIAREQCALLVGEENKRCLAQARLQYDADRRYARKRADQGY